MFYCKNCGSPLSKLSGFCPHCGYKLSEESIATKPPEKAEDEKSAATYVPPTEKRKLSVLSAADIATSVMLLIVVVIGALGWCGTFQMEGYLEIAFVVVIAALSIAKAVVTVCNVLRERKIPNKKSE